MRMIHSFRRNDRKRHARRMRHKLVCTEHKIYVQRLKPEKRLLVPQALLLKNTLLVELVGHPLGNNETLAKRCAS